MARNEPKTCPFLDKLGIDRNAGYEGVGICQVCPLGICILGRSGPISRAERDTLENEAEKWQKKEDL